MTRVNGCRPDILIVDDDIAAVQQLQVFLHDLGDLRAACTGEAAVRLCKMRRPDLMLLDFHLAGPSGLQILGMLREALGNATVPVMFISAERAESTRVRALELDALDWLTKPLDGARVRARVRSALDKVKRLSLDRAPPAPAAVPSRAVVLAVEDDRNSLAVMQHALDDRFIELITAVDARSALALSEHTPPDLALIDIGLPGGTDGFGLARRLLGLPGLTELPVIFITQSGDVRNEVRALEMGAFDFISKPVAPAVLRARVQNALRLKARAAVNAQHEQARWRRISDEQVTAAVENALDAVIGLDERGCVAMANPAAVRLLQLPPDQIGRSLPLWLRQGLPESLMEGECQRFTDLAIDMPDGQQLHLDIAVAHSQVDGEWLQVLSLHDLSLRRALNRSERHGIEAERQAQSVRLLMNYLSHEIGNPLAGIEGLGQLLLSGNGGRLNPLQEQRLDLIIEQTRLIRRLLSDLRAVACGDPALLTISSGQVPVAELMQSCADALCGVAAAFGARFELHQPPPGLRARADADRLRQILINLMSNACKYGRPGGRVRVCGMQEGRELILQVEDDGPGLDEEQAKRLFVPFERLGRSDRQGNGLGLAVCRQLAQAMGGSLELASAPGQGCRFSLHLPDALVSSEGESAQNLGAC